MFPKARFQIMTSTFFSSLHKKLGTILLICSTLNIKSCCSIFLSETIETCGTFLQDFQTNSSKRGDVTEEIIKYLQLRQKTPVSLIIKNELSQRELLPALFRSMKYDCYLHVHINFGNDLFSTKTFGSKSVSNFFVQESIISYRC